MELFMSTSSNKNLRVLISEQGQPTEPKLLRIAFKGTAFASASEVFERERRFEISDQVEPSQETRNIILAQRLLKFYSKSE
jgi:hypothetical protein